MNLYLPPVISILLLLLSCFPFTLAQPSTGDTNDEIYTLPNQRGSYPVSSTSYILHTNRTDILAPVNATSKTRSLVLSIYQPLIQFSECPREETSPYMPSLLLSIYETWFARFDFPGDILSRIRSSNCPPPTPSAYDGSTGSELHGSPVHAPLLIFSHGSTAHRLTYQALVSAVASAGYTVVSVGHTYDAAAELLPPEEQLVLNNYDPSKDFANNEDLNNYLGDVISRLRSDDVFSVLDAVEAGQVPGLERFAVAAAAAADSGPVAYEASNGRGQGLKAGIWGHSLGGCTTAYVASSDESQRVVGAVNLDGGVFGSRIRQMPVSIPYLHFTAEASINVAPFLNDTLNEQWEVLGGYKRWIMLRQAAHNSFMDGILAADALGARDHLPEGPGSVFGTINGERMLEIASRYVVEFFDMAMKGGEGRLLDGPSEEFPEMTFFKSDELPVPRGY